MQSIWKALLPAAALCVVAAGGTRANYRVGYKYTAAVVPTNINSDRGFAVNRNLNSPYYGYLYTSDTTNKCVRILKPDNGIDSTTYTEVGTILSGPSGTANPHDVFIGEDDTVWIADYGDRQIRTAPPMPLTPATPEPSTVQINLPDFDTPLPTGVTKSNPRALWVVGGVTNATVYIAEFAGTGTSNGDIFNVQATNAKTVGTATRTKIFNIGFGAGPYGVTVDNNGNSYWTVSTLVAKGNATVVKYDSSFVKDTNYKAVLPAFQGQQSPQDVTFVPDASAVGGGYLYVSGYNTGAVNRYALDAAGTWLDGYGNNSNSVGGLTIPVDAPYTRVNLSAPGGNNIIFGAADLSGYSYALANPVTPSGPAVVKTLKLQPYIAAAGMANSATDAVKSSPTTVDGVVYFGSDDGYLYAYDTATGEPVANFPVNINDKLSTPVKIQSRPAVYVTTPGGKGIYFTTSRGDVCRVSADGLSFSRNSDLVGAGGNPTVSAPAVLPDGTVYVGVTNVGGSGVAKLNADLTFSAPPMLLADPGSTISSVAVHGNSVYVGLTGGTSGDIMVLKASDLTPQASGVAGGEGVTAPPFVSGMDAYIGTLVGNFYKVNSTTFAPDEDFGAGGAGKAAIGEPLPGSAFNEGSAFYVGSSQGKVWQVDGATGTFSVLYDTGNAGASIPGLVVNRDNNTLAFGTDIAGTNPSDPHTGNFYMVPAANTANARVFRGYGAFTTTPTLERSSGRVFAGNDDKNVYAFH